MWTGPVGNRGKPPVFHIAAAPYAAARGAGTLGAMRFRVRALRRHGRRVAEYGTASHGLAGDLTLSTTFGDKGAYAVATLKAGAPKDPDLLPPLYEPVLVAVGGTGLLLRGFESADGASYVQEWHCEPAPTTGS